jgi:hypothetical protein
MNQALYAHMNNKRKMKKKMENCSNGDKQVRIKNNVFIEEEKN